MYNQIFVIKFRRSYIILHVFSLNKHICLHIYTGTHTYTHTYIHPHTCICRNIHMNLYSDIDVDTSTHRQILFYFLWFQAQMNSQGTDNMKRCFLYFLKSGKSLNIRTTKPYVLHTSAPSYHIELQGKSIHEPICPEFFSTAFPILIMKRSQNAPKCLSIIPEAQQVVVRGQSFVTLLDRGRLKHTD